MRNVVKNDALAYRDSSTLTTSFKSINSVKSLGPAAFIRIVNDSDKGVTISYDGTTSHDYIRAGDTLNLNLQSNSVPNNHVLLMSKNLTVYVKGTAGTGNIYLAIYYLES